MNHSKVNGMKEVNKVKVKPAVIYASLHSIGNIIQLFLNHNSGR